MFSTTTITAALLLTSTTLNVHVNAIPIWSRLTASLAVRQQDGNATTPAQIAQGSNFFFNSLRLEDHCTAGQVGCISSQLAACSTEQNWEISPCAGESTCLAVPASDNTGVFVSCIAFQEAQSLIGNTNVAVDFGITSPPNGTATAPAGVSSQTGSASASATPTESSSDPAPTDSPTDSSSDPAPTDSPTDSSSDSVDPTDSSTDSVDPTATDSPVDPSATDSPVDPSATDSPVDPSATCTDDVPSSQATEYETITVVIQPDATLSGQMTTVTLTPRPTDPTSTDSASPDVTGTDGALPTSDSGSASATCTEDPTDSSSDPAPTDSSSDPAPTDSISSAYGSAPTDSSSDASSTDSASSTQQTGLTLTVPPNFSLPTATATATATTTPVNNVAPAPSASGSSDVSVVGTHFIPVPAPGRMVRVRRS